MDSLRPVGTVITLFASTGILLIVASGVLSGLWLDREPVWLRRGRQAGWKWLWAALAVGIGLVLLSLA